MIASGTLTSAPEGPIDSFSIQQHNIVRNVLLGKRESLSIHLRRAEKLRNDITKTFIGYLIVMIATLLCPLAKEIDPTGQTLLIIPAAVLSCMTVMSWNDVRKIRKEQRDLDAWAEERGYRTSS